ncbi:MAG TPA: inositol-3-phosphate synthase [Candidatus Binatia bacterium]|jgi:myo-inositol-1-phosphate synthase|nr:inositol-3-phosphate synthase [Candidatus Binatia bacterium]
MGKIAIGIVGVGNCASSLLQGIEFYRAGDREAESQHVGLMHHDLCGYRPADIEVVCAFDVDERKVGQPLDVAALAPPNNTRTLHPRLPRSSVTVDMGPVLDGVAEHMRDYPPEESFVVADRRPVDVVDVLRRSGAEILVNYLPVGSQQATEHYARACLEAGVAFINCIPVFVASDPEWSAEFARRGIPIIGDDVKSQLGATILHRVLAKLFDDRGVVLDRTYQLNTGGNTDFLNMLNRARTGSKRRSKTEAVQSVLPSPLPRTQIHIGPSDYVPWQRDNKVCFLRMEGRGFGNAPIELELRLSVEDSPNSAGCVIDAIRCCRVARDRGVGGPLNSVASYLMKHPPRQLADDLAKEQVERFLRGEIER